MTVTAAVASLYLRLAGRTVESAGHDADVGRIAP